MAHIEVDQQRIANAALDAAVKAGASYADIRINRNRNQVIRVREQTLLGIDENTEFGLGVRVIFGGAWGFSSTPLVTESSAVETARTAVDVACANAALASKPVLLAPTQPHTGGWSTPIAVDPVDVAVSEKLELLLACTSEAMRAPGVKFCSAFMHAASEEKYFASSEGAAIEQTIHRIWPLCEATAVASSGADFQTCRTLAQPMGMGYEYIDESDLISDARRAGQDAGAKLAAPPLVPGKRDLVLYPSMLWLPIHESIGHATELDRVLGYEANFAGTSFVSVDQLGNLQYGSPVVNVVGDRTLPRGLATVGYDDEGVEATRFDIIKNGVLSGFQTIREQAHIVGDAESHACSYADSFGTVPLQRMPNISLLSGSSPLSPDEMIGDIEDGLLIHGDGSWSIDMQRRNFQFGGQVGYLIKNGKIDSPVRDFAFQSSTLEFWNSCDAICSEEHAGVGGSYYCGKGQPCQVAPVSHGSAPARFRQINTINTNTRG